MSARHAALAAACTLGLVTSACGDSPTGEAADAPATTVDTTVDTAAGSAAGAASDTPDGSGTAIELLDFTAPLVGGGTFDGAAYGERPVVLWFWAPT